LSLMPARSQRLASIREGGWFVKPRTR
jgi:hypothetical protein